MSEKLKNSIGNLLVIAIIIITIALGFGMVQGANWMGYIMIAVTLVSGPLCFLLYLNEIRKGVFKVDDSEIKE